MNDYRNYMDSVSVDMALHRKIMSRLTQRTSPVRRSMALTVMPLHLCAASC